MIKRKVIEDSDDDENTEPTPPRPSATRLSDITLSTLFSLDGSPSHEILEQSADPSTSSTGSYSSPCLHLAIDHEADHCIELLNRELRAAHESLIEPTPKSMHTTLSAYSPSQHRITISPTASRLKTKRSKTSIEKSKAKKPLKTYGRSSQDIFEFHGGSDGELDITPKKNLSHNAGKCEKNEKPKITPAAGRWGSQDGEPTRRPITSSGGDTVLLSTEPKPLEVSSAGDKEVSLRNCMPPPASKSTSFDQSQRSRKDPLPTIAGPAPLKSAMSDVRLPSVVTYSETPSNDGASAPTRFSHDDSDEERCRGLAQSVKLQSTRLSEATKRIDLQPTEDPAPSSSASGISPSKIIAIKRTTQTEDVSAELSSHLGSEHLGSAFDLNTSAMVNPVVLLPALTDTEEAQDELSLSIPRAASKSPTKPEKASKRKRIIDDEPFDELGSDENAIEVPKEHYRPRPSTRRSGVRDGEVVVPTDFSKKPEAIGKGKRKTKRHKTTAFQELLPKDEDEDEDEEMKVAPDPRFEIPEKKPPKISAERDQPNMERNDDKEEVRLGAQRESNQAVQSTGQKKRGRPKKVVTNVSEELSVDETEADLAQDDAKTVNLPMSKESRKKKSGPIIDEQEDNDDGAPATEDDPEDLPTNVLNEINGNMVPPMLTTDSSSEKSPTKSTPRRGGRRGVAYRVGLSKRARIAPLLRIVRK